MEIDARIVPVEVKSGAAGAMKSLHQFMLDKDLPVAVRLDRNPPSVQLVDVKTTQGHASATSSSACPTTSRGGSRS